MRVKNLKPPRVTWVIFFLKCCLFGNYSCHYIALDPLHTAPNPHPVPQKLHPPNLYPGLSCASRYCRPSGPGERTLLTVTSIRYPTEVSGGLTVLSLCSQDTFSVTTKKASLDIFLPDGRGVRVEILTSDTAERVLGVNVT